MSHGPLIFDSVWDRAVQWFCVRIQHRGAERQRRMRGEITCKRCSLVIGYWR